MIFACSHRKNARSPFCKPAYRRICGTCTHFSGDLRGGAAARCLKWQVIKGPAAQAWDCDAWERKSAPAEAET